MYAVIFRAEIASFDDEYFAMAEEMRNIAINKYGCKDFVSCSEGKNEIAISYWETEDQILEWKKDIEHIKAQENGRSKWYKSYTVQVTKVAREYSSNT
jgi:heme-degrading monooxygenase HmoA